MPEKELQRQITASGVRVLMPVALFIVTLIGLFLFWPQISAIFKAQSEIEQAVTQSERAAGDISDLKVWRRDTDNLMKLLEERINRTGSRVDSVSEKEDTLEDDVDAKLSVFEKRIVIVEDETGDLKGDVSRLDAQVRTNTEWRDDQEKRAATRVTKQEFRDVSIAELKEEVKTIRLEILPVLERKIALLERSHDGTPLEHD